jgi:hypothetical protein
MAMNLELLSRKRTYYEETAPLWVRRIWSRPQAFDHFIKYNRAKLAAEGALVKIGRDYFVVSDKFPVIATEILGLSSEADGVIGHDAR